MMITITLFAILLFFIFKWKVRFISMNESQSKEPPEAPGALPFFGHLLSLGQNSHLKLIEWAKVHGSLFIMKLGTQRTLVIDDPELMREIFSLPAFIGKAENVGFEYSAGGRNGVIMSEGKSWEKQRRFTLKHLSDFGFGKNNNENLIAGEVSSVVKTFKQQIGKPFVVEGKFNFAVVNGLWILTTGQRLSEKDSPLIKLLLDLVKSFNRLIATGAMFSSFICRIAPLRSGWQNFKASSDLLNNYYTKVMEDHKQNHDFLNPRDLIDTYISEVKSCDDQSSPFYQDVGYKNLRATIGDIFQAGSEPTSSTLTWAILYLTVHKEVQIRLQNEIDNVIGKLRNPTLSDRSKMPYAEAVILEILRKSSLIALGNMHRALFDTQFHGFLIRKGTGVIGNIYSSHHNPKYWDQPKSFMPERFLTPDGLELIKKPVAFMPFQVGRRLCLGEQFAKDNLFMFITSIYQAFQTLPDKNSPDLDMEPIPGFILNPKKFTITLQERN